MNAAAFRQYYDYHFAENRLLWDICLQALTLEQFMQPVGYSRGSAHDQIVHLMDVDEAWFSDLRGVTPGAPLTPAQLADPAALRAHWDTVEADMRAYLAALRDDMLLQRPFSEGEDKDLILWQVLLHVVNHGTDHRAQLLRLLNDVGVKTPPQDYVFYAYEHPIK